MDEFDLQVDEAPLSQLVVPLLTRRAQNSAWKHSTRWTADQTTRVRERDLELDRAAEYCLRSAE